MEPKQIKRIISKNSNDIAFLIGNGINHFYNKENLSWNDLLLQLWEKHSFVTVSEIPKGISLTEFYDTLEIQNYSKKDFSSALQKDVQNILQEWVPNKKQNILLNRIKDFKAPILTTNFDDLIPRSMDLEFFNLKGREFTDYYPWSCYYGENELRLPTDAFGVWFLNGMIKYSRSIKLGLTQYMGNIERARKLIHEKSENINFEGKNRDGWPGLLTWLHILFNKSIFVFGLRLDENEIFIRWLLIERAKYFRKFPNRKHKGWYLTKEGDSDNEGKIFFLNAVGFEIIKAKKYKTIYEDIWIQD